MFRNALKLFGMKYDIPSPFHYKVHYNRSGNLGIIKREREKNCISSTYLASCKFPITMPLSKSIWIKINCTDWILFASSCTKYWKDTENKKDLYTQGTFSW